MATFQDFSLVKKEIEFVKQRNNIDQFSRAFIFTVLEKLYPGIEQDDYITDGGGDLTIDAYYIDEDKEEINIFQFKSTESFTNAQKKNAFKDGDISKFIINLEKIWDRKKEILKDANSKTVEAIKSIWEALGKGYTNTNIWFISNYYAGINGQNKIDELKEKFRNKFKAELIPYSLDDVIQLILTKQSNPREVKLQLKGRNYFEDTTGEIRALIGEINALNFLQSIMDSDNLIEDVFNENVRVYLSKATKINKQIYSSIEKQVENFKFFFYNNGITAICDSYKHPNTDSPTVSVENFQIVNGGQTIHSIYEAYKKGLKENIKNIYLLLRIYELKKRNIGQDIARYTNTQNPVRSRDIMSNDNVQIKLQQELLLEGWYYERKKYEYRDKKINNEKKIDAEKLGQIILSFYLEKPGSAKNKKQEIFGKFYDEIFNDNKINAKYVLLPFLLYKEIEKEIKEINIKIKNLKKEKKLKDLERFLNENDFMLYAHYYLLSTLKLLAEKNNLDLKKENMEEIFKKYKDAKEILKKLVDEKKSQGQIFSMLYLFKTDDFFSEIKKNIKNKIQ